MSTSTSHLSTLPKHLAVSRDGLETYGKARLASHVHSDGAGVLWWYACTGQIDEPFSVTLEPRHKKKKKKNCLWGFRPGKTQTGLLSYRVDNNAMIRNRYNRIPHPAPNTKWKGTNTTKTALELKQHKWKAKGTVLSQQMATRLS